MKKVSLFLICIGALGSILFFQNCSKVNSATDNLNSPAVNSESDNGLISFDEKANYSEISSLNQKDNIRPLYEYRISGGFRQQYISENDFLEGFEERCASSLGFRILSDGTLIKFFQFQKQEIQYMAGYFDDRLLQLFSKTSTAIIQNNAKLNDLNIGAPVCVDGPETSQILFDENGNSFELAKVQNCHQYARAEDSQAVKLSLVMEKLYRRLIQIKAAQKQVLIEKTSELYGFRPTETPNKVTIRIFSDGRVIKSTFFDDELMNLVELVRILSNSELDHLKSQLSQFYGKTIELKDLDEKQARCADAPSVTYSIFSSLPRPCQPRPDQTNGCGSEVVKREFAKHMYCHSFSDSNLIDQSKKLILFMNQF